MAVNFPVSIQTKHYVAPNLQVYYPVVYGFVNRSAQRKINKAITRSVIGLIEQQGYYENPRTEVLGYYEIKNNQREILSLSNSNYAFAGGAHGLTIIKSLTFDVTTGREYSLADLFKPNSNYVQVLSEIVRVQIKARDVPLLGEFKGIRPDQDYYIADKCLVLYFQLYEITPYVYGFPMFPISVFEIQDIIDPDGPLGRMATND